MQLTFGFGAETELTFIRDHLVAEYGRFRPIRRRDPIGQLVKSLISGRTRDHVSLHAYERLVRTYPGWTEVAVAKSIDVEVVIADVTFPDVKARHLGEALRAIAAQCPDFDLNLLGGWSVDGALAWLERLPGVGRKVSASTLNFSDLALPAFVVDTHVLRVLQRFGFVGRKAGIKAAYGAVMAAAAAWEADDFAELHLLLKHLGQTICRADRAGCRQCPISRRCQSASLLGRKNSRVEHP